MKTIHHLCLAALLGLLLPYQLRAQPETPLFDQWNETDKAAIEALVMYPQTTRTAILEAARHPELLIKTENLQMRTSDTFQELIADLEREEQTMIYDLSRYPGLISRLAFSREVDARDLDNILTDYPEVIHERARKAYRQYGGLLQEIDELHLAADHEFNVLIATYPSDTREAFHQLTELPEVLTLLTQNIRMTILVGDLYEKDPDRLNRQMDSLNLVVAEANARELENWQQSVESDPTVREELQNATEAFAGENGYDDEYYDYDTDDMYYAGEREPEKYVVEQYFYYNYPYWFGFPRWYYYPRWRPYPLWYESGFYVVFDGSFIIHRLPSFYFTHWYFYQPHHHYYYPHLSRQFVRHTYYGPRPGTSSIAVTVRSWQERNQDVISEAWLQNDRNSVQRFREYGKFELDRQKYNQRKIDKELSPTEFLERNRNRYPNLYRSSPDRSRELTPDRQVIRPRTKTEGTIPQTRPDERTLPSTRTDPSAIQRDRIRTVPRTRTDKPTQIVPKVQPGVDQHRRTIERTRPARPQVQPRINPRTIPRTVPQGKTKTTPRTKKRSGGGML